MDMSWSNNEVELIIADYFKMLTDELAGKSINKAEHRRYLLPLLINRSAGSIEFKHQNISAVLINLGQPYIKGYKPRFNYQKLLEENVIEYLKQNHRIENLFRDFAEKKIIMPKRNVVFENFVVPPPKIDRVFEPTYSYHRNPIKVNYLEKEQRNINLGNYGEELVFKYEKWNLIRLGKEKLADEVKWISQEEGDGAGFDILSKNLSGTDKYIEVKTTKLGKESPFFFTRNELYFSQNYVENYHLFRLFNLEKEAKMFTKNGSLDTICQYIPLTFKGFF
jgi:hypothetical protein